MFCRLVKQQPTPGQTVNNESRLKYIGDRLGSLYNYNAEVIVTICKFSNFALLSNCT